MKKIILSTIAATSLLMASSSQYKYEVTPILGKVSTHSSVDIENHNAAGVSFGINKGNDCKFDQIEFGLLHTSSADYDNNNLDTDITRLFVNGIKDYKINDEFKLFALVGLGHEHIEHSTLSNKDDQFFNYGVGFKYALNETMSLRADVRHLLKFDGDKNILYTIGLSIPFGEKAAKVVEKAVDLDSDNDGILDSMDNCPNTKIGVEVGASGCEILVKIDKDSDNDGVLDSIDKCPTTPYGEKVDSSGCTVLMIPENLDIVFDSNSANIHTSDETKFKKYVNYLNKVKNSNVVIEGHTDSTASIKYNQILSEKRANSAKNKLINMGIDFNRIKAIGYGELKPLVPNNTEKNKQINRRVTARIVK